MADFERTGWCDRCGREYVVTGSSANPSNETQSNSTFRCECGGRVSAMLPGSANPERVRSRLGCP
jgi:DNA-directed RNA polymerase subunit RPC12/RpoP